VAVILPLDEGGDHGCDQVGDTPNEVYSRVFRAVQESVMAKIRVERAHQLDRQALRNKAEQLAESLSRDYQLSCRWQGDVLQVQRSGVKGSIALDDQRVRVELHLGLLLSPLSGRLQSEIEAALDKALV